MKARPQTKEKGVHTPLRETLQKHLLNMRNHCIDCPKCRAECAFLKKYGSPRDISINYDPSEIKNLMLAYECSLCGLCGAVCPVGLRPEKMFLEMRREAVDRNFAPLPEHEGLLAYERRGTSRRYSCYMIPEACDTVFFPGCTFTGTRPDQTMGIYNHLKLSNPSLGIVLDCCCKPSHDLGRQDYFTAMNNNLISFLVDHGVKKIISTCPNCHQIFQTYGGPIKAETVYEALVQSGLPDTGRLSGSHLVSVHDPCVLRSKQSIHAAVRKIATEKGFSCVDMLHSGCKTICCGEGGNVEPVVPEFADTWASRRRDEANGRLILTYCAGCANKLRKKTPTVHILDAILNPELIVSGHARVSNPPWTYVNRLRIKRLLKRQAPDTVTHARTYSADPQKSGKKWGRIGMIFMLAAIILALHTSGIGQFLNQSSLQGWVERWGALAPLIYILLYTVAPVLFLPGLPITVAGGILFGPVWGVIYTIIGATLGACASFLVARYMARDWIMSKLRSPRWKRLDDGVARHGWKIVAFTRLIPAFPFNLLNYAFGLTSIRFFHYAAASFVFMLPGCIAFIVFASSIPQLIKGKISTEFVAGLFLVVIVMLLPVLSRRFSAKNNQKI